ncbi:MAG: hypothetical protein M3Y50_10170 [Acidobacteriota bacterium]|nr:hypothetical protein [Acidobacteriota bacterium]
MTDQTNMQEWQERFEVIESMMLQGRRTTEYWGWSFVLWGTAYLVATAWSSFSHMPNVAWPVTMTLAGVATIVIAKRKTRGRPATILGRAMLAVWTSVGAALFVFSFATMWSGHWELHTNMAAIECLLGVANMAGGIILRWRAQAFVGIFWWIAAVATCLVPAAQVGWIFLAGTLFGMIGFGLYLMVLESRARAMAGKVAHA